MQWAVEYLLLRAAEDMWLFEVHDGVQLVEIVRSTILAYACRDSCEALVLITCPSIALLQY